MSQAQLNPGREFGERGAQRRARRVLVLLLGVIVLSLADLVVTVTHLKTVGMIEANPLAAWIIRTTGSIGALAAFKCLTVAICVALLYRLRRYVEGEIATWCAVGILVGMCFLWHDYSRTMTDAEITLARSAGDDWILLD